MSVNNYLRESVFDGQLLNGIQFRFGFVRELDYKIGDEIKWRNSEDNHLGRGVILVPGIGVDKYSSKFRYFVIRIDNNIIKNCEEISEDKFDELDSLV